MKNGYSFEQIKEVLKKILSIEELQGKLIISGGIVPYIIANKDSGRLHSDIDIICKQDDMKLVRENLKKFGIYDETMDSLYYDHNDGIDYGVDTYISGIPVGFYPYEVKSVKTMQDGYFIDTDMIIQRTFTHPFTNGKLSGQKDDTPELKVKEIPSLLEKDYFSESSIDGIPFKHTSLEVIKATKLLSLKSAWRSEKDLMDIKQIDTLGTDPKKQQRIDAAMKLMRSTLDSKPNQVSINVNKENEYSHE